MSIIKKSIQETTGNSNNVAQSFKQNVFFESSETLNNPFIFNVPMYTTYGGTKDYYGQNPLSIFTNLVDPFIRFNFTANTYSLSGDTVIKHDIYRVDWDTFEAVQNGYKSGPEDFSGLQNSSIETIEEIDGATGEIKTKTITRNLSQTSSQNNSQRKAVNIPIDGNNKSLVYPTTKDIQDRLLTPIISLTASTSGITSNIYDLVIDQFIKNVNFDKYKTELFKDKSQYIIDTNFIFTKNVNPELRDYLTEIDGSVVPVEYKTLSTGTTSNPTQTVNTGLFSGTSFIGGEFFSYIKVPDKPIVEYPSPTGQTNTFTPEIFWTNGESADEYVIQVTYNTGDTAFTQTVFSYVIPKLDEYKEGAVSKAKTTDIEFSTTKTIRKYQVSLKSNSCLLYRVGNVKFIKNMFDVKQSVVTFSDYNSMCTQVEPIITYVYTESDSPSIPYTSGYTTPPSLSAETPAGIYSLSGVVSGSTVTGATIQLVYPNSNFVTTTTDVTGMFMFTDLQSGMYTLNTSYRGYANQSSVVTITGNTSMMIDIEILWDNIYDTFASKENDIIKY